MRRLRRATRDTHGSPEAGLTLIEVVVAMTVLSIFMAMFTSGMLQMYRTVNKNESQSTAQSEINALFLRLDREVRYAAGISDAGAVGADQYVEYLITNTGTPTCVELRLSAVDGQIQRRTWLHDQTPTRPTGWVPLASAVTAATPFERVAPTDTYQFQRLRLRMSVSSGGADTATAKETDITFTALNTNPDTKSSSVCTEGRTIP